MVTIDLSDEEIKIIHAALRFSLAACPLSNIGPDTSIAERKLDKLAQKIDRSLGKSLSVKHVRI